MIYISLSFSLFFPMVLLNIIALLLILIFKGFKKFIVKFDRNLHELYLRNVLVIFISILTGNFCFIFFAWKKLLNRTQLHNLFLMKFFIYFQCTIMSIIIFFPQCLLINIVSIIIYYIFKGFNLFFLTNDFDRNFYETFHISIKYSS